MTTETGQRGPGAGTRPQEAGRSRRGASSLDGRTRPPKRHICTGGGRNMMGIGLMGRAPRRRTSSTQLCRQG
eukprot:8563732-Pyramimonas_sp.AAC.2